VVQTGKVTLSDKGREGSAEHEWATCPSIFVIQEVAASLSTSRKWPPWYLIVAKRFSAEVIDLTKEIFSYKVLLSPLMSLPSSIYPSEMQ
jgi:hypothetical protein